jgi:hypothetical protein
MSRRDDLRTRLTSFSGTRAKALAIGRWVALNRDELLDGAPPELAATLLAIEQAYYRVADGEEPVTSLVAAMRGFREAATA